MTVSPFDTDHGINLELEDTRSDGINILVFRNYCFSARRLNSFLIPITTVNHDAFEVIQYVLEGFQTYRQLLLMHMLL